MNHLLRTSVMALAFGAVVPVPVLAHDAPRPGVQAASSETNKGQPASHDEAHGQEEGPDTEDMFGFTTGTDVLERGHYEASTEAVSSFGKRIGHYHVDALKSTFTFAPIDGFSIELGARGSRFSVRNVLDLDNRRTTGFEGLSAEFKWQLIKRDPSPFGLTLLAEPHIGFLEEDTGVRGRSQGLETRLLLDTALIPNTLFAGFNAIYEMDKFRPRGMRLFSRKGEELDAPLAPCIARPPKVNAALVDPEAGSGEAGGGAEAAGGDESDQACTAFLRRKSAERSSRFGFSGALAFQAIPNVFLGAEVRYLRAYDGIALQHFRGEAVFVGPTLYAKLSEHLAISAAFSTQVAGHAVGVPGRLDLDNFSHHQAKLKIKYEF
jgi:hypothetical protein